MELSVLHISGFETPAMILIQTNQSKLKDYIKNDASIIPKRAEVKMNGLITNKISILSL